MLKNDPHARVGRELKAYFIKNNLSQDDVAKQLEVSQQYVSSLLNGRPFGKNTARKWAAAFNLNPSWLITGDGNMFIGTSMDKVEDQISGYNSQSVARLEAILADKEILVKQLLSIIEDQAKTIKMLHGTVIP